MPRIAEFRGIVITMYRREHGPPHFHAVYGEDEAVVGIETMAILHGRLPGRIRRLVLDWAAQHPVELADNWQRAQRREAPLPIPSER